MAPTLTAAGMPSKRMGRGDDHRGGSDEDPSGGRSAIREGLGVNGATAQKQRD